jgi:nitrile hydratase subunit beta
MNSIHDMGGMHGLGPLVREVDEPIFHAPWEARVAGLMPALGAWRMWNSDAFRQVIERIPAVDYLRAPYYEKRLIALTTLATESGLVTRQEITTGQVASGTPKLVPCLAPEAVPDTMAKGAPKTRPSPAAARFTVGQQVRARNMHPTTHTRLPRYVRGRLGEVTALHGAYVFPDSNALFRGENPQHVYTVRFAAHELWGEDANPHDSVCVDLWEPYLDHAMDEGQLADFVTRDAISGVARATAR